MTERKVLEHLSQQYGARVDYKLNKDRHVIWLSIRNCNVTDMTPLADLTRLTTLDLRKNQLTDITPLAGLAQLITLDVSHNQLTDLSPLTGLMNLTTLNVSFNKLTDVTPLADLIQLTKLDLLDNQLTDVTPLAGLTRLKNLNVAYNQISTLTKAFLEREIEIVWRNDFYNYERGINLYNNPLTSPPPEIVKRGNEAIREYFRQQREVGQDRLYEAKLLIVGEPGAGKTTFAEKMLNAAYELQPEESSTQGIDVLQWEFPLSPLPESKNPPATPSKIEKKRRRPAKKEKTFRVNIWDFGGQEIYKATHQFFLTKRSLYVLVADSRKEDTDFYYWLNIVSLLSDDSPVIILKNEKQDRIRELPERQLRAEFTNLKETLPANLATNRGLDAVLDTVRHYLTHLPHVGSVLPKTWVNVRNALEQDARNYIAVEEYYRICEQQQFTRRDDQLQLSGYLHDLGVCLHFQDDDLLKKTVILKPEWGTAAVYKVLDHSGVIRNLGCFTKEDLKTIWHEDEYADMRGELLHLMMKFQLCYEIPGRAGRYIAPQLLSENPPEYHWETHPMPLPEGDSVDLRVRYAYEFMPKGMLTRFIVAAHPLIEDQRLVWKSGVVLQKEGARAEIIEYYGKREIHIRVSGMHKKDLLTVVMYEFEKIHGVYSRLKYDTLIPCHCAACKGNAEPHFYKYETLKEFLANRQRDIQCQKKPYHMVDVAGLLDDVLNRWQLDKENELMENIVQELSAFLTPLPCFANELSRRAVLINAGLSDLVPSVNLSGSAYDCVASLLDHFANSGQIEEQIALLQEVYKTVGGEKKKEITRLIALLNTPGVQATLRASAPSYAPVTAYQTIIYGGTVINQQGDKPMATNTQFNNQFQNLNGDLIQGSQNFTTGAKTYNLHTPQDLTALLAELQKMIAQAPLPEDAKEEMAHEVKTAEIQAKKETPDKKKTVDALDNAKAILTKIGETAPQAVAVGQLLSKAIEYVGQWL